MDEIDLNQFKKLFFDTARDYVTSLEEGFLRFQQSEVDQEAVEQCFIAVHSLKSQSHVMGYMHFSELSGALEKIFRSVKDGTAHKSEAINQVIGKAVESLRSSLATLETTGEDIDYSNVASELYRVGGVQAA